MGYSPWGWEESDTTEWQCTHGHVHTYTHTRARAHAHARLLRRALGQRVHIQERI